MKLTYVLDYVFMQTPDGRIWTPTSYDAAFWEPYLTVYDSVTVVSRVQPVEETMAGWKEAEDERVRFAPLPLYRGALDYLQRSSEVKEALEAALEGHSAIVLRTPSNLARLAAGLLDARERPYAVEVVGDAGAALAPGVVKMAGRPLLRQIFMRNQRHLCASAIGVAYVAETLRTRYPERPRALHLVSSDVRLGPEWFASIPRLHRLRKHLRLVTVATLSQTYKGIDVLLRALALCRDTGITFSLNIIGDGKYRSSLQALAMKLGLSDSVNFAGNIPWGPQLIEALDAADLFVLPSRVEALPRALLEAMARGLPAISTRVGAIGEVLDERYLVAPGDARALADKIVTCVSRSTRLDTMSAANLERAQAYRAACLQPRWHDFHSRLAALFATQPQAVREPEHTFAA